MAKLEAPIESLGQPKAKVPTRKTPFRKLDTEKYRTSGQYEVQLDAEPSVRDTKRGTSHRLPPVLMQDAGFRKMILGLATVANQRVGTFDHLLNSHEALGCVMHFLVESLPEVFSARMLQGLIDLDDCFHKLVVCADPKIVSNRDKRFDGGFRTIEGFEDLKRAGKQVRDASSPPIRLPNDIHEARIVLAYRALLAGAPKNAKDLMKKLLRSYEIRTLDDRNDQPVSVEQVMRWSDYVDKDEHSLGRKYSWDYFEKKYKKDLLASKDPEVGRAFATRILNEVRWRQPTIHPELGIE